MNRRTKTTKARLWQQLWNWLRGKRCKKCSGTGDIFYHAKNAPIFECPICEGKGRIKT